MDPGLDFIFNSLSYKHGKKSALVFVFFFSLKALKIAKTAKKNLFGVLGGKNGHKEPSIFEF